MDSIKPIIVLAILILSFSCNSSSINISSPLQNAPLQNEKWVFLLHGMLSSPSAMKQIEKALVDEGYRTVNFDYSSRKESLDDVTDRLHKHVSIVSESHVESIHFVTHSFGGIVVRSYLAQYPVNNLGRFVMIAPPNAGSEWARILRRTAFFRWLLGHGGNMVTTMGDSVLFIEGQPPCEFGIIAGGTGTQKGFNRLLTGDNDGTVTLEETKLPGMSDFVQIKGQHTFILKKKALIEHVVHFLGHGAFSENLD